MEALIKATSERGRDAGDVIAVCPDGWAWSVQELTNPKWRIVRHSGIGVGEANDWLAPKLSAVLDISGHPIRLAFRAKRLNPTSLNSLPGQVGQWWADDSRSVPIKDFSAVSVTLVRNIVETKL
jgi:hypothetical protein